MLHLKKDHIASHLKFIQFDLLSNEIALEYTRQPIIRQINNNSVNENLRKGIEFYKAHMM